MHFVLTYALFYLKSVQSNQSSTHDQFMTEEMKEVAKFSTETLKQAVKRQTFCNALRSGPWYSLPARAVEKFQRSAESGSDLKDSGSWRD